MTKKTMYRVAAPVLALIATLALYLAQSPGTTSENRSLELHGLQENLTNEALAAASDVVVVGTVLGEESVAFRDDPLIPPAARSEPGYDGSTYVKATVAVEEVLAGSHDSAELEVARLTSLVFADGAAGVINGDDLTLEVGDRYVLFLAAGDGLWAGKHLALGPGGIGALGADDLVAFRDGESITLQDLRVQVLGAND